MENLCCGKTVGISEGPDEGWTAIQKAHFDGIAKYEVAQ